MSTSPNVLEAQSMLHVRSVKRGHAAQKPNLCRRSDELDGVRINRKVRVSLALCKVRIGQYRAR